MYHVMSKELTLMKLNTGGIFVDDLTGGHHNKRYVFKLYGTKLVP